MERTSGIPDELEASLNEAKELFTRTANLFVEDPDDGEAPGGLFKLIFEFLKKIRKEKEGIERQQQDERERKERAELR